VGILLLLGARRRQRNSCEAAASCPLDLVAMRMARSQLRLCVRPDTDEHVEVALHLQIPVSEFLEKKGWSWELRLRVRDQSKLATGQTGVVSSARDRLAGLIHNISTYLHHNNSFHHNVDFGNFPSSPLCLVFNSTKEEIRHFCVI
jgi:hypothetical protein